MSTISLDLTRAHLTRLYGDIRATWSWINDQRALFLTLTHRVKAPWFVVLEPAAHEWNDQDSRMLLLVIARAVKACDVLGLEPTPRNARRIISIVNDAIPELVRMPSVQPPERKGPAYGELVLKLDGKEIASETLTAETEGATYG